MLGKIAPVVGTYLIHSDAAEIAEMVLLEGFSPYQKTALLYESYFGWATASQAKLKLLPHEYKRLFNSLNRQDSDWLKAIQPGDGKPDICISFYHTVCWIVRLYQAKATQTGEALDTRVSDYLLPFLEREIDRFQRRF
ncbi:MAG: hypothetical protein FWD61_14970 [Phycisphaerales bacterium]|nr:hypothetical protein [Phycisphaerales bacterium]